MRKINFKPTNYKLELREQDDSGCPKYILTLEGQKLPPPSKRITLRQCNIRATKAGITAKTKRGDTVFDVVRINHLKSFREIRLHTDNILYPGTYVIEVEFTGLLDEEKLKSEIG